LTSCDGGAHCHGVGGGVLAWCRRRHVGSHYLCADRFCYFSFPFAYDHGDDGGVLLVTSLLVVASMLEV